MRSSFKSKKTFERAFKVYLPMVMAAEPCKAGSQLESCGNLSIPNKKGVQNMTICTDSLTAESKNGVISPKLTDSLENNKHDKNSPIEVDAVSQNGQIHRHVKVKFISEDVSSNNNLKSEISSSHRDQLLLLHLDLIERQQQLIQEKDREILELKHEKEQVREFC